VPRHLSTEGRHRAGVAGHGIVGEVPLHDAAQPLPLFRDGLMPATLQLVLDLAQLGVPVRTLSPATNGGWWQSVPGDDLWRARPPRLGTGRGRSAQASGGGLQYGKRMFMRVELDENG
jgi:hypothetical protein